MGNQIKCQSTFDEFDGNRHRVHAKENVQMNCESSADPCKNLIHNDVKKV